MKTQTQDISRYNLAAGFASNTWTFDELLNTNTCAIVPTDAGAGNNIVITPDESIWPDYRKLMVKVSPPLDTATTVRVLYNTPVVGRITLTFPTLGTFEILGIEIEYFNI